MEVNMITINSNVEYINPFESEIGLTFKVIEIEQKTDWCKIRANVEMNLKPTYTANISDLQLTTK